nr:MAG TPA: hypothetical protein [Caudoviricetes sp.]
MLIKNFICVHPPIKNSFLRCIFNRFIIAYFSVSYFNFN